ncbi:MAG: winged helix-turn-helix domain-containing protein [Candidatus Thorarchaeota archaeon]
MAKNKDTVPPMKDLAIISDPKAIKVLMEPTRSRILFKYLVNGAMTVKQLADALGKNPGTILHHIEKLKKAGLVVQERTEQTVTGIVQRYYRATAREYRLGLSELMQADEGVAKFAEDRLKSMVRALSVYGIRIEEDEIDQAVNLLRELLDQENDVSGNVPIMDEAAYHKLPESVRRDASRLFRKFILEEDSQYRSLREKWHKFMRSHKER